MKLSRIVITGVGLTAPNGNTLADFRHSLLNGVSGVSRIEVEIERSTDRTCRRASGWKSLLVVGDSQP